MHTLLNMPQRYITAGLVLLMLAGVAAALPGNAAYAKDIRVDVDQARLVSLERPGAEIIIGNPSIADVAVQSGRLLVITGKSTGVTNVIALDASGQVILSERVSVTGDTERLVTVQKGAARETHSCTPVCKPTLSPGDSDTFFEPLAKSVSTKLGIAQSALEGTQMGQ